MVHIKFKARKYEKMFTVEDNTAEQIRRDLADPNKRYIVFTAAHGGDEWVRLDKFYSVEFIDT